LIFDPRLPGVCTILFQVAKYYRFPEAEVALVCLCAICPAVDNIAPEFDNNSSQVGYTARWQL
jgi:hypothetical protein